MRSTFVVRAVRNFRLVDISECRAMAPKIRRRPATSIANSSGISSSENTDRPASGTLLEHSSGSVHPSILEHSLVGPP
eukprot:945246-Karenia_brevis.AAC.1